MEPNAVKKTPEAPRKPSAATSTKRVVVTIDAALAGDPLAAREAAIKVLQQQNREEKEATARKHAANLKTIEQAALAKMLSLFFPVCPIPSVAAVDGANNKVISEALKLANSTMRQLRQQFVSQVSAGQVRDALTTLEAAVQAREGGLPRGGQKDGQGRDQEAGR